MAGKLPFGRLLAEGVVVVGSILLAFTIDAWWDGRGVREQESELLVALLQELRSNDEILATNADWHRKWAAHATILLEAAAGGRPAIPPDSLDLMLASLSGFTIPVYERGALDAILSGDGLPVLRDREVKQRIASWGVALERVVDHESDRRYYTAWMDFLRGNTYMPQIWNEGHAQIPGWQTSEIPARGDQDHGGLLANRVFVNLTLERKLVHEDMLFFYSQLHEELEELMAALEAEVELD